MNVLLILAAVIWAYMSGWFVLSLLLRRNDVADVAWGIGFVLIAWVSYAMSVVHGMRGLVVSVLVTCWGLRLAWHILARNRKKSEDYRYAIWRREWGSWFFVRSYVQVFVLQGIFLYIISAPVLFIHRSIEVAPGILDFVAIGLWITGFIFEAVADIQLSRFIADRRNKGRLMTTGLWRFSRHPNYFGEVTQWWAIYLLALKLPFGFISIVGPALITVLILFVSGVPLLEKKYEGRADFAEYKRRTSVFVPLPSRKV